MSITLLTLAFFVTALVYSAVGFGGGSTYNALLVLALADVSTVPVISLACNIIVVMLGSWRFAKSGAVDWARFWPLAALSVPAAWLGGYIPIPAWLFVGMLALALTAAGLTMLWQPLWKREAAAPERPRRSVDLLSGGALGLVAGMTGIGGGIFLSPLLYLRRWASGRTIAATAALFILVNSLAGLAGQIMKSGVAATSAVLASHWPLFPAVAFGGLLGSAIGSSRLKEQHLRILTAILILYVAVRLGLRFPSEWAKG